MSAHWRPGGMAGAPPSGEGCALGVQPSSFGGASPRGRHLEWWARGASPRRLGCRRLCGGVGGTMACPGKGRRSDCQGKGACTLGWGAGVVGSSSAPRPVWGLCSVGGLAWRAVGPQWRIGSCLNAPPRVGGFQGGCCQYALVGGLRSEACSFAHGSRPARLFHHQRRLGGSWLRERNPRCGRGSDACCGCERLGLGWPAARAPDPWDPFRWPYSGCVR